MPCVQRDHWHHWPSVWGIYRYWYDIKQKKYKHLPKAVHKFGMKIIFMYPYSEKSYILIQRMKGSPNVVGTKHLFYHHDTGIHNLLCMSWLSGEKTLSICVAVSIFRNRIQMTINWVIPKIQHKRIACVRVGGSGVRGALCPGWVYLSVTLSFTRMVERRVGVQGTKGVIETCPLSAQVRWLRCVNHNDTCRQTVIE